MSLTSILLSALIMLVYFYCQQIDSTFEYIIDKSQNIKLTGIPDDLFLCENGSYFIVDYKTARFTQNQDELMVVYKVQLNGYAYIFDRMGMGKVSGLILCYYEPNTEVDADRLDSLVLDGGFRMNFKAHLLKVDLDTEGIVKNTMQSDVEIVILLGILIFEFDIKLICCIIIYDIRIVNVIWEY